MITYKSGSNVMPAEIDNFSSPTTVYRNYDIVEIEKVNEQSGEMSIEYSYMVDHYDRDEYYQLYPDGYIDDTENVIE